MKQCNCKNWQNPKIYSKLKLGNVTYLILNTFVILNSKDYRALKIVFKKFAIVYLYFSMEVNKNKVYSVCFELWIFFKKFKDGQLYLKSELNLVR